VKNPKPQCILQDQAGNKYCALTCGFRGGDCPSEAICTKGVCAYNSTNAVTTILEKQDTQGDHHYEAPPCQDDEVAARLSGGGGALCAAQCGDDGSCSQDFPEDVKNPKPQCILQDQAGNKYCALTCGFRGGDCPSEAICTKGVCAYNSTNAVTTILEKQDADFSQLVCKDRKCSAECETESYSFSDCLPVVGGGSARGASCCDNAACVVQGSDFGLLLDVYQSDDCTGSSQRMKQPVTQCLHTSSGDKKFAKFVCGGNSSSAAAFATELHLQSPTYEYV